MTTQRSRLHLRSWIRTEKLLQQVSDNVKEKCMQSVLDLFASNKELLHFVVKHTSQQRLDNIYEMLKKEHEVEKLLQRKTNANDSTKLKSSSSNFHKISKESISNICGFLNRDDIQLFKETSRRISIICLEEMGKYSIGISNAFQIKKHNINNIKDLEWYHYMSYYIYDRYHHTTKYNLLFEKIQTRFNIPIKYQIPITIQFQRDTFDYVRNKYDNINAKEYVIMFDKRNVTILTDDTYYHMDEDDIFDPDTDTLITLYQFNIIKQQIDYVKCILIDTSVDIQLLKNYILTFTKKDETIKLYHMNDLGIGATYVLRDGDLIDFSSTTPFLSIMFQTDTDVNHNDWLEVQNKYLITNLQPCFLELDPYIDYFDEKEERERNISIKYAGDINILKPKIKEKLNMFKDGFQVTIDSCVQIIKIKEYIAAQFDDSIGHENIELFKVKQNGFDEGVQEILKNSCYFYEYECKQISFEVVPYNTTENRDRQTVFRIHVYSSQQTLFPYNNNTTEPVPTTITIKAHSRATVNDCVNQLIKEVSNPLMQYQTHLQQSLENYSSAPHPMCYAITSKMKERLRRLDTPKSTVNYSISDVDSVTEFSLYMIPNEMTDKSRTKKLMVRFAWASEFHTNMHQSIANVYRKLLGLPLIIWVNENDTLDYVIKNQIVQQYNDHIFEIYKVNYGRDWNDYDKITLIPQNERNSYKIGENVLQNNQGDFIVITLKSNNTIKTDQFRHVYFLFS